MSSSKVSSAMGSVAAIDFIFTGLAITPNKYSKHQQRGTDAKVHRAKFAPPLLPNGSQRPRSLHCGAAACRCAFAGTAACDRE
eukprot:2577232-Pleurochrysis_carterae.AAC.1